MRYSADKTRTIMIIAEKSVKNKKKKYNFKNKLQK